MVNNKRAAHRWRDHAQLRLIHGSRGAGGQLFIRGIGLKSL